MEPDPGKDVVRSAVILKGGIDDDLGASRCIEDMESGLRLLPRMPQVVDMLFQEVANERHTHITKLEVMKPCRGKHPVNIVAPCFQDPGQQSFDEGGLAAQRLCRCPNAPGRPKEIAAVERSVPLQQVSHPAAEFIQIFGKLLPFANLAENLREPLVRFGGC